MQILDISKISHYATKASHQVFLIFFFLILEYKQLNMTENVFEETSDPPDSYFSKKLLVPGAGFHCPVDGATCSVSLECLEPAELNFVIGYPLGEDIEIKLGEGDCEISENIDKCILGMKRGETSELTVYVAAQNDGSSSASLSENCYCEYLFKIKLKSFHNLRDCYKMSNQDKLEVAKWHKNKGVELFKACNIKFAFRRFSKALKYLLMINSEKDIPSEFNEVKCQCYLNLAACQLKCDSFEYVVSNCSKALTINPKAVKGLVRRGQAYLGQSDTDKALADLRKALKLEPNNKYVKDLIEQAVDNNSSDGVNEETVKETRRTV